MNLPTLHTQPEQALENELVAQLVGLGFATAAVTDETAGAGMKEGALVLV